MAGGEIYKGVFFFKHSGLKQFFLNFCSPNEIFKFGPGNPKCRKIFFSICCFSIKNKPGGQQDNPFYDDTKRK